MQPDTWPLLLQYVQVFPLHHTKHFWELTYSLLRLFEQKGLLGPVSEFDLPLITLAASLHDIGKSALSPLVMDRPSPLTTAERKIMETHPAMGLLVLESSDISSILDGRLYLYAREICIHHHERWDGHGYPDGLKGDDIPPYLQIVSLADAYDALRAKRSYRPSLTHDRAVEIIRSGGCGAFNPPMLTYFLTAIDSLHSCIYTEPPIMEFSVEAP